MSTQKEILVIDYGMGNLFSIRKVLERLGYGCHISDSYQDIRKASKLILPGVGHFGKAMQNLQQKNLIDELNESVLIRKTPVLGICLGMQLFATSSEEGEANGLNWIKGKVVKFGIKQPAIYKVPHVGWNTLTHEKEYSFLLNGLNTTDKFYFVHSFHFADNEESETLTKTNYEYSFVSSVQKDNITGVQFHPEKSHKAGEQMISNFLKH